MKRIGKWIFIVFTFCLIGIYAKQKIKNSENRFQIATNEINKFESSDEIKEGDLIFQTSLSTQSKSIQLATNSIYSHCGIIYKEGNNYRVLEAVQPVKNTPLDQWVARGKDGKFIIKRLRNAEKMLTPDVLKKLKLVGNSFVGKNYDITFEWSDDKMYCSELIWKIYQRAAGLEIGKLQKLKDFDLKSTVVKNKMKERYGINVPLEENVISPIAIFNSDLLITVKAN